MLVLLKDMEVLIEAFSEAYFLKVIYLVVLRVIGDAAAFTQVDSFDEDGFHAVLEGLLVAHSIKHN